MEHTKEKLETAILELFKVFNEVIGYKTLMRTYPEIPRIIEIIVYVLFAHDFDLKNYSEKLQGYYRVIQEYPKELNKNTFVKLK